LSWYSKGLVDGPLAAFFGGRLGYAQFAFVEVFDNVLDGGLSFGLVEQGAVVPGGFNGLLGSKAVEDGAVVAGGIHEKREVKLSAKIAPHYLRFSRKNDRWRRLGAAGSQQRAQGVASQPHAPRPSHRPQGPPAYLSKDCSQGSASAIMGKMLDTCVPLGMGINVTLVAPVAWKRAYVVADV
jgi:hypothetical protein